MSIEWSNGDDCRYAHDANHEYIYIGEHPNTDGHYVFSEEKGITYVSNGYLIKPETPQQREERERLEAAYDLYSIAMIANEDEPKSFEHFSKHNYKSGWIAVTIKTNYQKAN